MEKTNYMMTVDDVAQELGVSKQKDNRYRIKRKSSLMLFDRHPEYRDRYGRHFWARGYYCETVGNVNEATIKKYIADQYESDRLEGEN